MRSPLAIICRASGPWKSKANLDKSDCMPASISAIYPDSLGIRDRLGRPRRPHGDECARISILDPDNSPEAAILSQRHPPGARHRIEFPGAFPGE